jgi:ribosomal protein S27AE
MSDREYRDTGKSLRSFDDEIWSCCPRCGSLAIVHAHRNPGEWPIASARVVCTRCGFLRERTDISWLGPFLGFARRKCSQCGRWLSREVKRRKADPDGSRTTALTCPGCRAVTRAELMWSPPAAWQAVDPHFGLPLYLQAGLGRDRIWAYNLRHLGELRRFARATLRSRAFDGKWSVITRLPAWFKARANRERVLACIRQIEARARSR